MADNTIEALRVLQVGIEAVKAVGTLTLAAHPTAMDTHTIGATVYTWVASGANEEGEINIGADLAAAKVNIVAAINGTDGWNSVNPYATAGAFVSNDLPITAKIPGTGGNAIVFSETFTSGSNIMNGSGFLGGTTPGSMARGTPVAATARLAVEQLEWGDEDENQYKPRVANGVLVRNRGPSVAVQHGTRFTLPEQAAIWEQLPLWFSMLFGPPVLSGAAGGPYTFTWTADPDANPNPFAVTLQRRFSNGLGNNVDERASYAMLDDFGLSFAVNEHLRLNAAGFARRFNSSAITGGLTLPDFEVLVSALSTIYIDDTWGGVGGTLLSSQVIGWNLNLLPGIFPRHTAEGRTDLDFTKHQLNGDNRGMDLEVTCLLDPTTYAAEQPKANGGDFRAVRIRVTGADSRQLDIDMAMRHANTGLWAPGVDEGQDTVTFMLEDSTDFTNLIEITLTLPETYIVA